MSFTPNLNNWTTGVTYNVNDVTTYGKNLYTCTTYHTAGTFTVDLLGGYWELVNKPVVAKNYMASANFEDGTTGMFTLFSTTLTNKIPTGAISSSPTGIYPYLTAETTDTLSGKYSLQTYITGDSITAGNGIISNPIAIAPEDASKVMQINFSYSAVSGSNLGNFSGTSSNTWAVYVYDNANSAWIQPAGTYNIIQSKGVGKCTATFQTPSNVTSVRVAIICINSNSMGWFRMMWDSFYLGPQVSTTGPAVSDWTSYTPTVTHSSGGATNVTHTGRWRRVGDSIEVMGTSTFSAASAAFNEFFVALPSGLTFDTSKLSSSGSLSPVLGTSFVYDAGATLFAPGNAVYRTSTIVDIRTPSTVAGTNPVNVATNTITNTFPITFLNGDTISWQFKAPITGWSSNTLMSNDTDTRVVAASRVCGTQISVPSSTYTYLDFSNMNVDTHSAWRSGVGYSAGSWTTQPAYVVPVAGIYSINASIFFPLAAGSKQVLITKNGSSIGNAANDAGTSAGASLSASSIYTFNAGDLIQIMIWQNAGSAITVPGSITAAWSHLEIQRLSGPATVAATETVAAYYNTGAAQSIPTGAAYTVVNFNNRVFDSHGSVTTGAGVFKFTAPVSGTYLVNAGLVYQGLLPGAIGNVLRLAIINSAGNEIHRISSFICQETTVAIPIGLNGTPGMVKLRAGEYIQVVTNHGESAARSLATADYQNTFSVVRVGNY